jgi:hypothetical protein
MRNYPEFDEEDEDEEDEDGEDETAPQLGEASKPRKKGVVAYCLYLKPLLTETAQGEEERAQPFDD